MMGVRWPLGARLASAKTPDCDRSVAGAQHPCRACSQWAQRKAQSRQERGQRAAQNDGDG